MAKSNRRLIISVIALVMSLLMVGTTTFAWFTLGNTASIEAFEVNVRASTGSFQIAVSAADRENTAIINQYTSMNTAFATLVGESNEYATDEAIDTLAEVQAILALNDGDEGYLNPATKFAVIAALDSLVTAYGEFVGKEDLTAAYTLVADHAYESAFHKLDGVNDTSVWVSELTKEYIAYYVGNLANYDLEDLTPAGSYYNESDVVISVENIEQDTVGTFKNATTFALTDKKGNAASKGSFVAFDVQFLATEAMVIEIDLSNSSFSGSVGSNIQAPRDYSEAESIADEDDGDDGIAYHSGDNLSAFAANAARLGVVMYNGNNDADVDNVFDGSYVEMNGNGEGAVIYDLNAGVGMSAWTTTNLAQDIYDLQFPIHPLRADQKKLATGTIEAKNKEILATSTNKKIVTLAKTTIGSGDDEKAVYVGKITVYVWIEGKDADCFNSILNNAFTTEIAFKEYVAPVTP